MKKQTEEPQKKEAPKNYRETFTKIGDEETEKQFIERLKAGIQKQEPDRVFKFTVSEEGENIVVEGI